MLEEMFSEIGADLAYFHTNYKQAIYEHYTV